MRISRRQELLRCTHIAFFEFDRLGAQHSVREIQIPFMWRRVRTLGHVAQVAHKALVDYFPVILFSNAIHFQSRALVHQIKKSWERSTQTHATPTSMADIKNTLEFVETFFFVVEVWVLPI